MDITNELPKFLSEMVESLFGTNKRYTELCHLEGEAITAISDLIGEEYTDRLIGIQADCMAFERMYCFLLGLRLGMEAVRTGG